MIGLTIPVGDVPAGTKVISHQKEQVVKDNMTTGAKTIKGNGAKFLDDGKEVNTIAPDVPVTIPFQSFAQLRAYLDNHHPAES